jgi:putative polyhydroxyalkanoate system protein
MRHYRAERPTIAEPDPPACAHATDESTRATVGDAAAFAANVALRWIPVREISMTKIDIERPHHLGTSAARLVIEKVAVDLQQKFGLTNQWRDDVLQFSGTGVNGAIAVSDHAVHVTAQLGLLLSPFRGRIEQDIREKLDQHFA